MSASAAAARMVLASLALALPLLADVHPASAPPTNSAPTAVDAVEEEYRRIMIMDDEALAEADRWIREERAQREEGAGLTDATLKIRILDHFRPVRKAYEDFLRRHADHARCHLAYGSFLNEIGEEELAVEHMEKSRKLDPTNPAAWNNLANHYGHRGPIRKAFDYYAEAIKLNANEPVYFQNLATCVYLFRKDAQEHYGIDEAAVFEKALNLYRKAMALAPTSFVFATAFAESFYGMLPRTEAERTERADETRAITDRAINAWNHALTLAQDDLQRQGVLIHLARNKRIAGRYDEARQDLASVTHTALQPLSTRVLRSIDRLDADPATPSENTTVQPD